MCSARYGEVLRVLRSARYPAVFEVKWTLREPRDVREECNSQSDSGLQGAGCSLSQEGSFSEPSYSFIYEPSPAASGKTSFDCAGSEEAEYLVSQLLALPRSRGFVTPRDETSTKERAPLFASVADTSAATSLRNASPLPIGVSALPLPLRVSSPVCEPLPQDLPTALSRDRLQNIGKGYGNVHDKSVSLSPERKMLERVDDSPKRRNLRLNGDVLSSDEKRSGATGDDTIDASSHARATVCTSTGCPGRPPLPLSQGSLTLVDSASGARNGANSTITTNAVSGGHSSNPSVGSVSETSQIGNAPVSCLSQRHQVSHAGTQIERAFPSQTLAPPTDDSTRSSAAPRGMDLLESLRQRCGIPASAPRTPRVSSASVAASREGGERESGLSPTKEGYKSFVSSLGTSASTAVESSAASRSGREDMFASFRKISKQTRESSTVGSSGDSVGGNVASSHCFHEHRSVTSDVTHPGGLGRGGTDGGREGALHFEPAEARKRADGMATPGRGGEVAGDREVEAARGPVERGGRVAGVGGELAGGSVRQAAVRDESAAAVSAASRPTDDTFAGKSHLTTDSLLRPRRESAPETPQRPSENKTSCISNNFGSSWGESTTLSRIEAFRRQFIDTDHSQPPATPATSTTQSPLRSLVGAAGQASAATAATETLIGRPHLATVARLGHVNLQRAVDASDDTCHRAIGAAVAMGGAAVAATLSAARRHSESRGQSRVPSPSPSSGSEVPPITQGIGGIATAPVNSVSVSAKLNGGNGAGDVRGLQTDLVSRTAAFAARAEAISVRADTALLARSRGTSPASSDCIGENQCRRLSFGSGGLGISPPIGILNCSEASDRWPSAPSESASDKARMDSSQSALSSGRFGIHHASHGTASGFGSGSCFGSSAFGSQWPSTPSCLSRSIGAAS
eukprot:TRINITY_DN48635_c0_g1_i1.p1 TRINITY_DN48635_c0_g1~~TRINITY_DN48635_c0_g1_i1.p1  ORF type:complete len:915 (+),score=123.55 TRINITY_DN48635_c0_g1_i1:62-2806(+)